MPTLNLNEAIKLYYGNTEIQKLYKGSNLLYPIPNQGDLYWRVDFNMVLAEIQVSFDGLNTPTPLNTPDITFSRLPPPNSTTATAQYNNTEWLTDNNATSFQYVGSTSSSENQSYQIVFNTPKNITSLWFAPQLGPSNVPTYLRLYKSNDGNNWILTKEWTSISLISGQLKQFVV